MEQGSNERAQAWDQGMIRPFLLMVSMHPAVRHTIACMLGVDLITSPVFGVCDFVVVVMNFAIGQLYHCFFHSRCL